MFRAEQVAQSTVGMIRFRSSASSRLIKREHRANSASPAGRI